MQEKEKKPHKNKNFYDKAWLIENKLDRKLVGAQGRRGWAVAPQDKLLPIPHFLGP